MNVTGLLRKSCSCENLMTKESWMERDNIILDSIVSFLLISICKAEVFSD